MLTEPVVLIIIAVFVVMVGAAVRQVFFSSWRRSSLAQLATEGGFEFKLNRPDVIPSLIELPFVIVSAVPIGGMGSSLSGSMKGTQFLTFDTSVGAGHRSKDRFSVTAIAFRRHANNSLAFSVQPVSVEMPAIGLLEVPNALHGRRALCVSWASAVV